MDNPCETNNKAFVVALAGEIGPPEDYVDLFELLLSAEGTVQIHMSCAGDGNLATAEMLRQAMLSSKASIEVYTYGAVTTAGAIIALASEGIKASPGTKFIIQPTQSDVDEEPSTTLSSVYSCNENMYREVFSNMFCEAAFKHLFSGGTIVLGQKEAEAGRSGWGRAQDLGTTASVVTGDGGFIHNSMLRHIYDDSLQPFAVTKTPKSLFDKVKHLLEQELDKEVPSIERLIAYSSLLSNIDRLQQ